MRPTIFRAGGALTDEHAAVYIEREADHNVLTHLLAMDYILVIEPRQQGKTSLVNYLMRHPALEDYAFAYVDVTTPNRSTEAAWYQTLCRNILQLLRFIPRDDWPAIPQDSFEWRDFLFDLAAYAIDAQRRIVITLDEIGAITFPGATDFFSVLRAIYNSRQAETEFRKLTFLLVGAFHPRDLIQDPRISPFNIAQRVRLPDFSLTQVRKLVSKGSWPSEQATSMADRIYYWTNGQPYLTQMLCSYLDEDTSPADVDARVRQLRREDENNLPPLLKHLSRDTELRKYMKRILAGERIKFYPHEHRRQAQLELLGVIKSDSDECCCIRNRIYEEALSQIRQSVVSDELSPPVSPPPLVDSKPTPPVPICPQRVIRLQLQLTRRCDQVFEVRTLRSPMGETRGIESKLPYTADELIAVLKALCAPRYNASDFSPIQCEALERLGLLHESHFVSDLPERVGQSLYDALMVEDVEHAFQMALNQVRPNRGAVALELRFDRDAVELAQYPWELLYHEQSLLLGGTVELTRYISYPQAITPLTVSPPLRLLYVQSRPIGLRWLDRNEQTTVRQALVDLEADGLIQVDELAHSTYEALLDHLETQPVHILHFDGHGIFARQCPECQAMNYAHHPQCQAEHGCHQSLTGAKPYGYLAFEDEQTRHVTWMQSSTVGNLLSRRSVRLAVLSACRSGSVGGEELFSSSAPALIQAGVPAVVSTQLPISVSAAVKFMRGFYRALARLESLPAAVNAGRLRVPEREWFIPTLYLRSKDDEGYLFTRPHGG